MATKKSDATPLEKMQNELGEAERQLREMDSRLEDLGRQLGATKVKARLGDRKAEQQAGSLALDRAKLASERNAFQFERDALKQQVESFEREERQRQDAGLVASFTEITERARTLEATLTAQMAAAAKTARELRDLDLMWQRAHIQLGKMGLLDEALLALVQPRNAVSLFQPAMLFGAENQLRIWNAPPWRYPKRSAPIFQVMADQPEPQTIRVYDDPSIYFREDGVS